MSSTSPTLFVKAVQMTVAGTAAAPVYQLVSATTGIYQSGTNTFDVATAGVNAMTISAAQAVTFAGLVTATGGFRGPAGSAAAASFQVNAAGVGLYSSGTNLLDITTAGVDRWRFDASGNFIAVTDNTLDVGASAATRPRDLWLGRNAAVGGTLGVTGVSTLTGRANVDGGIDRSTAATLLIGASSATAVTVTPATTFSSTVSAQGTTVTTLHATSTSALDGAVTTSSTISAGGNLTWGTDAASDIGASGGNRPRDFFLSRNATIGGTLGVTGAATLSSTLAVTGTQTLTGATFANGGLDRSTAAALLIGATNATSVTITPATTISGAATLSSTLAVTGIATFSDRLRGPNGAVGTPSYSFTNSTGSGWWYTGTTNVIACSTAGVEVLRFDASQRVGIGITSLTYPLEVKYANSGGGVAETGLQLTNTTATNSTQLTFNGSRVWSLSAEGSSGSPSSGFTFIDRTAGVTRLGMLSGGGYTLGGQSSAGANSPLLSGKAIVSLADSATPVVLGTDYLNGIVFVATSQGNQGIFAFRAGNHDVTIISDPDAVFSKTINTGSKTNIYWDGSSSYSLQNKRGSTVSYAIWAMCLNNTAGNPALT